MINSSKKGRVLVNLRILAFTIRALFVKVCSMSVKDSNGTELQDGDSVQVIKNLKVKGTSSTIKRGTVYKNIQLTSNDQEIECGKGKSTVVLKTCFLKKA